MKTTVQTFNAILEEFDRATSFVWDQETDPFRLAKAGLLAGIPTLSLRLLLAWGEIQRTTNTKES